MKISFDGTPALVRRIELLREQMITKTARKAVLAGAKVIAEAMTEAAPIGPHKTPGSTALELGALKADIRARIGKDDFGDLVATAGPGEETAYVARFVEYGHRQVHGGTNKVTLSGGTRGEGRSLSQDVQPHPFLRPAFEASQKEAEAARDEVLKEGWSG